MSGIATIPTVWVWIHILAIAVATYALRVSFIGLFSYYEVPEELKDQMTLIPPAVLAAVAVPPLFYRGGEFHLSPMNPFLIAGFTAALVAWRTESLIGTIGSGFGAYFLVTTVPIA